MTSNTSQPLPPGWRIVHNVTGSVWYLDPNDVVHEKLPDTELMGALLQIASLKKEIDVLKEKLASSLIVSESGVISILIHTHQNRKYNEPPQVMLTPFGVNLHATATLTCPPTSAQFSSRLINYNGSWETGHIYWIALCNSGI